MLLEGSCHCGVVAFSANSHACHPYMYCYCSICRKLGGGGGYGINISADYETLNLRGEDHLGKYQAWMDPERSERSPGFRIFCRECGTALWVWDPRWPEIFHPYASCIDTALPTPPERNHIFVEHAPAWVPIPENSDRDKVYDFTGKTIDDIVDSIDSLEDWHRRRGLWVE